MSLYERGATDTEGVEGVGADLNIDTNAPPNISSLENWSLLKTNIIPDFFSK